MSSPKSRSSATIGSSQNFFRTLRKSQIIRRFFTAACRNSPRPAFGSIGLVRRVAEPWDRPPPRRTRAPGRLELERVAAGNPHRDPEGRDHDVVEEVRTRCVITTTSPRHGHPGFSTGRRDRGTRGRAQEGGRDAEQDHPGGPATPRRQPASAPNAAAMTSRTFAVATAALCGRAGRPIPSVEAILRSPVDVVLQWRLLLLSSTQSSSTSASICVRMKHR